MTTSDVVLILTTAADDERAELLARALVEERLAACVNVLGPMVSIYRWKEALQRDVERQVVIKTTRALVPAVEARLHQLHAYEVPEFLVVPVEHASAAYVGWVEQSAG